MKFKTSRKQVYERYSKDRVIALGYCEMQFIEPLITTSAYTCGVYGWNANVYFFDAFCICTGYRPFGSDNKKCEEIIKKYDRMMRETPYEERKKLLIDFEREMNEALK